MLLVRNIPVQVKKKKKSRRDTASGYKLLWYFHLVTDFVANNELLTNYLIICWGELGGGLHSLLILQRSLYNHSRQKTTFHTTTRVDSESRFRIFVCENCMSNENRFSKISLRFSRVSLLLQISENALFCEACESQRQGKQWYVGRSGGCRL